MVDAVWPAVLPDPVWASVRIAPAAGGVLETSTDIGPSKRRMLSTAVPQPVSFDMIPVSEASFLVFEAFFRETLALGVLPFEMPHPLTAEVRRWRFVLGEAYEVAPVGEDALKLSVNLQLLP